MFDAQQISPTGLGICLAVGKHLSTGNIKVPNDTSAFSK